MVESDLAPAGMVLTQPDMVRHSLLVWHSPAWLTEVRCVAIEIQGGVQFELGHHGRGQSNTRAAAVNRPIWSFGLVLCAFGPRGIHLGGFLGPVNISRSILVHFS